MVQSTRTRLFLTEKELLKLQLHLCARNGTFQKKNAYRQQSGHFTAFMLKVYRQSKLVLSLLVCVEPTLFAFLLVPQQQQLLL